MCDALAGHQFKPVAALATLLLPHVKSHVGNVQGILVAWNEQLKRSLK